MKTLLNLLRRARRNEPAGKPYLITFHAVTGLHQQLAMGPGDAAAYGGVRVDVHANGELQVQRWPTEAD